MIDGTEPYADTEIYYLFTGSTTPHSSQTTVEEIAYRDVAIRRWDHGNLNDSGALYRVNLTFSQDGYFYTLSASFGGAALEPEAQLTPELRTALATHAQDTLLSQCQQMIDIGVHVSLGQRIFGVGTIIIHSSDKSAPHLELKNVKNPLVVKELIHKHVESMKTERGVRVSEFLDDGPKRHDPCTPPPKMEH